MRKEGKRKALAALVCGSMLTVALVGGTLAYLTDTDSDVNVMTLGNVQIAQHEYQRAVNEDGTYKTGTVDDQTSYMLEDFEQGKALLPIVGDPSLPSDDPGYDGYDGTTVRMSQVGSHGGMQVFAGKNAQDKFVTVENTGKTDAYVRTLVAFEQGSVADEYFDKLIGIGSRCVSADKADGSAAPWVSHEIGTITVDGNNYYLFEYVYRGASDVNRHVNGVLPAGETTYPSLCQVYMSSAATNEDVEALDGNGNGTYDILVFSQAVQTAGFADAKSALDEAFGAITAANHPWVDGVEIPKVKSHEGVNYVTDGSNAAVSSAGGDTVYRGILSDGKSSVTSVEIGEGVTRLNDRALCKAPSLTSVTLPDSLTYIDESVFQQSGITSIVIPENVVYIGKQAFGACGSLETITINAKSVTIANYVARACANLKEVYIYSDSVTFESGSMYFTNKENADASGITFYVKDQTMADNLYSAFSTSHSYGLLIKSLDGATTYYNTLK